MKMDAELMLLLKKLGLYSKNYPGRIQTDFKQTLTHKSMNAKFMHGRHGHHLAAKLLPACMNKVHLAP